MAEGARTAVGLLVHHALLRTCMEECLAHLGTFAVAHRSAPDAEGLHLAEAVLAPAVVVLDLSVPPAEEPAPDVWAWLAARWSSSAVLALTDGYPPAVLHQAAARCKGFLSLRSDTFGELGRALKQLALGEAYIPLAALKALAQPPPPESPLAFTLNVLNDTQRRMLDVVCAPDEPTWEVVAARIHRSKGCVEENATFLYNLLGVKSKAGLVAYGRPLGFGQGRYS